MSFEAILFITNGVLRDMLEERGWAMTPEECFRFFVGKAVRDERATIEARTGLPLTEDWMRAFYERRNRELDARLTAIAGAHDAVDAAHAHVQARIACASGADRYKVEMQLAKVGMMDWFAGRIFSGHEMPRSKPAPDVYLAAARHLDAEPTRCLVIEDTATGVTAGVAAGATVWAYCPQPGLAEALRRAGASRLFTHMGELPGLLAAGH